MNDLQKAQMLANEAGELATRMQETYHAFCEDIDALSDSWRAQADRRQRVYRKALQRWSRRINAYNWTAVDYLIVAQPALRERALEAYGTLLQSEGNPTGQHRIYTELREYANMFGVQENHLLAWCGREYGLNDGKVEL